MKHILSIQWCLVCLLAAPLICAQAADITDYKIDPEHSQIQWLVYKAGALARFGHNHVIAARHITGSARLSKDRTISDWTLQFPVADLSIDDPEQRAQLGDKFTSVPTAEDIAGTRSNMLSNQVLDGIKYPLIRVSGQWLSGTFEKATMKVKIDMLSRSIALTLPAKLVKQAEELTVQGAFSLTHEQLGMEPFSVMMGALKVDERMDFSCRIVLQAVPFTN